MKDRCLLVYQTDNMLSEERRSRILQQLENTAAKFNAEPLVIGTRDSIQFQSDGIVDLVKAINAQTEAVRQLTEAVILSGEEPNDEEPGNYMDGTAVGG